MKKRAVLGILILSLLVCVCSFSVFAGEKQSKDVKGKTEFIIKEGTYVNSIDNGESSLTTGDGTNIRINGENLDSLYLCVIEVKKGEDAFGWLESVLGKENPLQKAYVVMLLDRYGTVVRQEQRFEVTIQAPMQKADTAVYHVDTQGEKTMIETQDVDGMLTFTAKQLDYYTMVSHKSQAVGGHPKTGDQNFGWICGILAALSVLVIAKRRESGACEFVDTTLKGNA